MRSKISESLEAWLNARPEATRQHDAVIIAQRAACRVLPIVMISLTFRDGRRNVN